MRHIGTKILAGFLTAMMMYSCGLFSCLAKKEKTEPQVPNGPAIYEYAFLGTRAQLDSMCIADTLSNDLGEDWLSTLFVDYETNEVIYRYLFIKESNASAETTYVVTPRDTMYKISRRIRTL